MSETSSGNFPDAIALQMASFSTSRIEATDVETAYSGREVRRSRFAVGGYRYYAMQTVPLTQADAQTLRDFLRSMRGRYLAFYWYPPDVEQYSAEAAGTVASASSIVIPFKNCSLTAVYVGGVSKAFTVSAGIGSYGEDRINFTGGAQTGAVTIDGTARERVLVRNDLDNYDHSYMVTPNFHTIWTLKFKEVK